MNAEDDNKAELIKKAEKIPAQESGKNGKLSTDDYKTAIHELHVHQIEIETQNDELRKAHFELGKVRDQYADLFDFAPVGYLVLDSKK